MKPLLVKVLSLALQYFIMPDCSVFMKADIICLLPWPDFSLHVEFLVVLLALQLLQYCCAVVFYTYAKISSYVLYLYYCRSGLCSISAVCWFAVFSCLDGAVTRGLLVMRRLYLWLVFILCVAHTATFLQISLWDKSINQSINHWDANRKTC